jgi:hypothetical protein
MTPFGLGAIGLLIVGAVPVFAALATLTLIEKDERKKVQHLRTFSIFSVLLLAIIARYVTL